MGAPTHATIGRESAPPPPASLREAGSARRARTLARRHRHKEEMHSRPIANVGWKLLDECLEIRGAVTRRDEREPRLRNHDQILHAVQYYVGTLGVNDVAARRDRIHAFADRVVTLVARADTVQ